MTLRLAWRNVRRSARDYAIYFLTLALGVAMFYAFNALTEQSVMFDALSTENQRMLDLLEYMMGLFSGAVAFVLAFLVVYANRFLLKRRKREFGMYLMLGMGAGRVARILLVETALIGALSLAAGLLVGVGASQGLSFATAALMGTTMTKYQFVVSVKAIVLTLACFAGIFLLSALVDVVFVSRRKLADLISAHEGSERQIGRNPVVSCVVFVLSLVVLGVAYWRLSVNGLVRPDQDFAVATVLMILGTLMFFWSVMNVALVVLGRSKGLRFRGLSMFTMRQISSKVNTTFASTSVICVMLFFALTTVSGGLAMVDLFAGNVEKCTRYDATINTVLSVGSLDEAMTGDDYTKTFQKTFGDSYERMVENDFDGIGYLEEHSQTWSQLVKDAVQLDYYLTDVTYGDLLDSRGSGVEPTSVESDSMRVSKIRVLDVAQMNRALAMMGKEPVELGSDQFLVNNTSSGYDEVVASLSQNGAHMTLFGKELTCAKEGFSEPMRTCAMDDVILEVVVPTWVADQFRSKNVVPYEGYIDVMYSCDRAQGDVLLEQALVEAFPKAKKALDGVMIGENWPVVSAYSGVRMGEQANGLRMIITYLAVYIGMVLMLTTAAVLAIQQLSEVADSLPRYRRLRILGAEDRKIRGSLRTQTLTYFLAPLGLALCHSTCALWVLDRAFMAELGVNIAGAAVTAMGLLLVLYACYYAVAYLTSRSMVARA